MDTLSNSHLVVLLELRYFKAIARYLQSAILGLLRFANTLVFDGTMVSILGSRAMDIDPI